MDVNIRLSGLEELLGIIYGAETCLSTLLSELGFAPAQIAQLQQEHLETVVTQFLDVIHRRLSGDSGRDTYYQILSRRYGLDGEPQEQLTAIAEIHGVSPGYLRQIFDEILHRCQSKSWQVELKKSLRHIVVKELDLMQERPAREQVIEKLERLSNLRNAAEFTRLNYETKRKELLKAIQAELDALETEYQPIRERVEENIASLENEIKTDVLLCGESIAGGMYRAVYTQGRVSWDNDGMLRYAEAHPDVLRFRKEGQPSVSFRVVNKD